MTLLVLGLGTPRLANADGPILVAPERSPPSFCLGEYADELTALSAAARRTEQEQQGYTFCVRTTATYECPSYGLDGQLRRRRRNTVAHGTAFGLRRDEQGTLLVTNEHVAEWPSVTDDDHRVDGVPAGCKRISESLRVVDNDSDTYAADDVPLSRVVSDPAMDISLLRSSKALPVLPWKLGQSGALRVRNVVDVRGFPLGVFSATNVGKVVSEHDHDSFRDWNHDDFVIDALLSQGNSGSPVLAVSCASGEFELVGVFHAGYTRGSALNVVVGVDQLRSLFTTLKRDPASGEGQPALDAARRSQLVTAARTSLEPYFPFGTLVAGVRAREDGTLLYALFSPEFPTRAVPVLVMEDLPAETAAGFGTLGRVWFGNRRGLRSYDREGLDSDAEALLPRFLDALRKQSTTTFALRAHDRSDVSTRAEFDAATRLQRELDQAGSNLQDLAQGALDLASRLGPTTSEKKVVSLIDLMVPQRSEPVAGATSVTPAPRPQPQPLPGAATATP